MFCFKLFETFLDKSSQAFEHNNGISLKITSLPAVDKWSGLTAHAVLVLTCDDGNEGVLIPAL